MGQRAVHAKGGIRMIIVSQNKERVLWFGRAFNALEYNEDISKKGKQETVRHTICISDGCLEEIAEYDSKARCLAVLKMCIRDRSYTYEPDEKGEVRTFHWSDKFQRYGQPGNLTLSKGRHEFYDYNF